MKIVLLGFTTLLSLSAFTQTPYLSILLKMDSVKSEGTRYKIEMKICEPNKMTERGDWLTQDTSKIDFGSLKTNEIDCGEYSEKGKPDLISGDKEKPRYNQYEFSNQVFAWEKIFVFKISNQSSRGWIPEMYLVMPMKYKSFITYIKLNDLEFQSGKVLFLSDFQMSKKGMSTSIEQSLKDHKTEEIKKSSLKELLEGK